MDLDGVKHSVEITAGTLFEAAVIGMNAMKVPDWFNRSTLTIEIRVKSPETIHTVSNAVLTAWLARKGQRLKLQLVSKRRLGWLVPFTTGRARHRPLTVYRGWEARLKPKADPRHRKTNWLRKEY